MKNTEIYLKGEMLGTGEVSWPYPKTSYDAFFEMKAKVLG